MVEKYSADANKATKKRHGITWEEKNWLVYKFQEGKCPVCQEPIEVRGSNIDHDHSCPYSGTHPKGGSCRFCIRGCLHPECNGRIIMYMEKYPWLISDYTREYLLRRPFLFKKPLDKDEQVVV